MTGFANGAGFGAFLLVRDDFSTCEWATNGDLFGAKDWDRIPTDDFLMDANWGCEWWPSRSGFVADAAQIDSAAPWWGAPSNRSGCNGRLAFVGYTRNAYGSPLGGVTVRLFRTSSDELVAKVVSDANGYYTATSPYLDAHYMVVHKTATPDVAGASVDTIIPS